MSSASTSTDAPKKAAQTHMVTHLAALAMLLDEDHIETLLLTLCRDNDIIPVFYRRDMIAGGVEEDILNRVFDGASLFETLNAAVWEEGRKVLEKQVTRAASLYQIDTAVTPSGGCGASAVAGGAAANQENIITLQ